MKEAFFILVVMAVIVALTAVRYRKQLMAMLHIWRTLRSMRQQVNEKRQQVGGEENISNGRLVNCAKCGTWVPEQKAIRLRQGAFYCSATCLERTSQTH